MNLVDFERVDLVVVLDPVEHGPAAFCLVNKIGAESHNFQKLIEHQLESLDQNDVLHDFFVRRRVEHQAPQLLLEALDALGHVVISGQNRVVLDALGDQIVLQIVEQISVIVVQVDEVAHVHEALLRLDEDVVQVAVLDFEHVLLLLEAGDDLLESLFFLRQKREGQLGQSVVDFPALLALHEVEHLLGDRGHVHVLVELVVVQRLHDLDILAVLVDRDAEALIHRRNVLDQLAFDFFALLHEPANVRSVRRPRHRRLSDSRAHHRLLQLRVLLEQLVDLHLVQNRHPELLGLDLGLLARPAENGMRKEFVPGDSPLRVDDEQLGQQVPTVRRKFAEEGALLDFAADAVDLRQNEVLRALPEQVAAGEHEVEDHSDRPEIHLGAVFFRHVVDLALENFGGHRGAGAWGSSRPTQNGAGHVDSVLGEPEIADFEQATVHQEHVGRLEIPMHHRVPLELDEAVHYLLEKGDGHFLVHAALVVLPDVGVQVA